jgi:hypothetical protein
MTLRGRPATKKGQGRADTSAGFGSAFLVGAVPRTAGSGGQLAYRDRRRWLRTTFAADRAAVEDTMLNYTVTEVQKILRAPPLRARRPSPARLGAGTLSGGRPTRLIATFRWWRWRRS